MVSSTNPYSLKQIITLMNKVYIDVLLPKNRDKDGKLRLVVNGKTVNEYTVLGRGSRGSGDTSFLNKGNTPTGSYNGSIESTKGWPKDSYGSNGAVRLKPTDGNAMVAEKIFGRSGLLIHGGATGKKDYWRGQDKLRATHGCLRLRDEDVKDLIKHIEKASEVEFYQQCTQPEIIISVNEI
jgi:lipoprotein-anchoring transpeptidase ErfK/SrfK